MTKQEQINAKLAKPIEIGDFVSISVPYITKEIKNVGKGKNKKTEEIIKNNVFKLDGNLLDINNDFYLVKAGSFRIPSETNLENSCINNSTRYVKVKKEYVSTTTNECVANPFKKETYHISFLNLQLCSIIHYNGYSGNNDNNFDNSNYSQYNEGELKNKTIGGINFNPFIFDKDKKKQYYQRGFIWNLEQKQLLIDSIYNHIEIGKFLLKRRSWQDILNQLSDNDHAYDYDCVDGKQRLLSIMEFLQNKYPDLYGNYWKDLSKIAQHRFLDYGKLTCGILNENTSDELVKETFLTLNFTGTPMSKEHIEYVKSINL